MPTKELVMGGRRIVWLRKDELGDAALAREEGIPSDDREAAQVALARAESRGFMGCDAVFVDGTFDGLHVRAVRGNGSLDWGRGTNIVERQFFRDGVLVPDPEWPGPEKEAEWETAGLRCHTILHDSLGHRCGYVGVPKDHPWYALDYDRCTRPADCPAMAAKRADPDGYHSCYDHTPGGLVEVHGGLTYAAAESDGWWYFGFDCAHAGDLPSPEKQAENAKRYGFDLDRQGHHWTKDEVIAETTRLAEQLAGLRTAGTGKGE